MRRSIQNVLALFVVIVSIFTFINMVSVNNAEAISCPEGYVCTPVTETRPVACPAGYTCTPTPPCPTGYVCTLTENQPIGCPVGYYCKVTSNNGGGSYRFETNLTFGNFFTKKSTGADVVALQTWLIANGFDIPSITSRNVPKGTFDADTKSAVVKYQKSIGIPETGFVGPLTREALNKDLIAPRRMHAQVISPNGGEVWQIGQTYTVSFSSAIASETKTISLTRYSDDSVPIDSKVIGTTKTGSFSYKVPVGTVETRDRASRYKIRVSTDGSDGVRIGSDESDNYFTITSNVVNTGDPTPSIKVLSPNGGETYSQGSKVRINWSTVNVPSSANLDVFRLRSDSTGQEYDLSYNNPNVPDSAFAVVTIPDSIPTGKYRFEIKTYVRGILVTDSSDFTFTITSTSPSPTPVPRNPSLNVTSPKSGEVWSIGDKKTITWSYADWNLGVFGNKYVDLYLVPTDGRSPIKLATNFNAPDGSVPVTIYERTSDGRPAWLPGRYKIRVACNTNNVAPFNSCVNETAGYITIISATPSPTPTQSPTSMIDQDSLNASIWNAVRDYFNSQP